MDEKVKMCEHCKARRATQVHHIDGNHRNNDPKNLMDVCSFCHAMLEGRSPNLAIAKVEYENFKDLQKVRIAIENRMRAFKSWELDIRLLEEQFKTIEKLELKTEKKLVATVKNEKIFSWLKEIRGVAGSTAAQLIAVISDISKFDTVSSLWHFMGLHVVDGEAPRMRKGQKLDFNPKRRALCLGIIGTNFIRSRSPYRRLYDEQKKYYEENRDWSKWRRYKAAIRYMIKMFLKDLWLEWRKLEKLPITEPHPQDQPRGSLETKSHMRRPAGAGDASGPDHRNTEIHSQRAPPAGSRLS